MAELNNTPHERINVAQADGHPYTVKDTMRSYIERDRLLLKHAWESGQQTVFSLRDWSRYKEEWQSYLSIELGLPVKASRIYVKQPPPDKEPKRPSPINLDAYMKRQKTSAIFVHNDCNVLFATLSPELCQIAHTKISARLK